MSTTVDKAFSLGLKPQSQFSVLHESDTDLHLTFDLGDIDPTEVSIRHSLDAVTLEVRPTCKGFMIENPLFLTSANHDDPALDAYLAQYAHLKWATCNAQELFEFFADYLISVRRVREEWIEPPLAMIKPLVMEVCFLRDNYGLSLDAEAFRSFLPLNIYSSLFQIDLQNDAQVALRKYLQRYSKIDGDEGNWDERSYELHAYCTMLISEVLTTGWAGGGIRDYRLANADVTHPINRPVIDFRSDIYDGKVRVQIKSPA